MRQLSGLDAAFLALETPTAPMLVGGLSLYDPRTPSGRFDLAGFQAVVRARLPGLVALRRQLAAVPFDLTRPYWIELTPDQVDLDEHITKTELPSPGGWRELSALMAFELARPVDRHRPLWEFLFVEGLRTVEGIPDGAVAIVSRLHHAAIDGVSGAEILGALFDGIPVPPASTARDREAGVIDLLREAGRGLAGGPSTVLSAGRSLLGLAGTAWSSWTGGEAAPPLPFSAPRTILNRTLSGRLSWAPAVIDLSRLRRIKAADDATLNDVVLAICAGALRAWLIEQAELPGAPLVAMVPVSVRADEERGEAGNLVSAMLVSLATDEADPRRRLRAIREATRASKAAHAAVGARSLLEAATLLPFALSGAAVRFYSGLHLAAHHPPAFNLVITNIPGPPHPLTVGGAALLNHWPAAPLFDGLGVILSVFSYAGRISIGITADHAVLPDATVLAAHLMAAVDALEQATG